MYFTPKSIGSVVLLGLPGLLAISSLVGCGSDKAAVFEVQGTVTFKGQALPDSSVTFVPERGRQVRVPVDAQGNYSLQAPAGFCRVEVNANSGETPPVTDSSAPDRGGPAPQTAANKPRIPQKYSSYETSGLSFEVKRGAENRYDIKLE